MNLDDVAKIQQNFPAELLDLPQWVAFAIVPSKARPGKTDKVPYNPHTGTMAKSDDTSTWGTFQEAVELALGNSLDGVGFEFSDEQFIVGIDLDDVIVDGRLTQWAESVVNRINSYTEISVSGSGIHIFARGALPPKRQKAKGTEFYEQKRFFAVTGRALDGTPTTLENRRKQIAALHAEVFPDKPETAKIRQEPLPKIDLSDEQLLEKMFQANNGPKAAALWEGDISEYLNRKESASEADLALCGILAFWTGGDTKRIDGLFRRSGLMRPKWDVVHHSDGRTYGQGTIDYALDGKTEFYTPTSDHRDGHEQKKILGHAEDTEDDLERRFALHRAAEAVPQQEPQEFIVGDLFPASGIIVIFGDAGTKKTYLMMHCGIFVTHGWDWMGRATVASPVLIVDEESGRRRMLRRLHALMHPVNAAEETELYFIALAGFDPCNVDHMLMLRARIQETGARMVIIDALVDIMTNKDENAAGDTGMIMRILRQLADDFNLAVVIIHHSNRQGQYRGSSNIKGSPDVLLEVTAETGSPHVSVRSEKNRDTAEQRFGCNVIFDGQLVEIAYSGHERETATLSIHQVTVLRYLGANPHSTAFQVMDGAKTPSIDIARRALTDLCIKKLAEKERMGVRGKPTTYQLTLRGCETMREGGDGSEGEKE